MSAFVVSTAHIDALISGGVRLANPGRPLRWESKNGETVSMDCAYAKQAAADAIGAELLAANTASVNHLYRDDDPVPSYTFRILAGIPDPVAVLKLLYCYEYQSCEYPGWKDSEAARFCDALRWVAVNALPGFAGAPWGTSSREVFMPKAA